MKVRFWGVRGSIAKPGPRALRYGGNTACVELRSDSGQLVVLDCGTGAHELGRALMREGRPPKASLLISHTHWDHIQGFPFFAPLFASGAEWDIYAPRGINRSLRDTLAGQMQYDYFPVTLEALGASIRYHELVEGAFALGDFRVRARYLDHPALTLGYRLEADGAAMVYACDHEPVSRRAVPDEAALRDGERAHVEFLSGADLVVHDAQYTAEEYPRRVGWGHSTPDYAAAVCRAAGARRLALFHHDPERTDEEIAAIVARVRAAEADVDVFAAAEGEEIVLSGATGASPAAARSAVAPVSAEAARRRLVLCGVDRPAAAALGAAAAAEALSPPQEVSGAAALAAAAADPATLLVIGEARLAAEAETLRAALAAAGDEAAARPRLLVVTAGGAFEPPAGLALERLVQPFSAQYAQTKLRAAMLRTELRWAPAPAPPDEDERLEDLRALGLLDPAPEERFDRIARIAAAAFHAPALINLVGRDRQWSKACVGLAGGIDVSREQAFCAHAILGREPLVTPDTLEDPRFADNPLVTGGPRIRFYAGAPIRSPRGHALGTLCVIDARPRRIDERQIQLLRDLASLVEAEIAAGWLDKPTPDGAASAA